MTGPHDDSTPIEGEIIPAGYMANDETHGTFGSEFGNGPNGHSRWRTGLLDEDDVSEIIRLRVQGVSCREIGKKYNISYETVRQWTKDHTGKQMHRSKDIARLRAEHVTQLETARDAAWELYRAGKKVGDPTVMKDALTRVESTVRALVELQGTKVPVVLKAEVQVTELTQEDLKAQAMIREAQAKAASTRERVEARFWGGDGA